MDGGLQVDMGPIREQVAADELGYFLIEPNEVRESTPRPAAKAGDYVPTRRQCGWVRRADGRSPRYRRPYRLLGIKRDDLNLGAAQADAEYQP